MIKELTDFVNHFFTLIVSGAISYIFWTQKQEKTNVLKWREGVNEALVDLTTRLTLAEENAKQEASKRKYNDNEMKDKLNKFEEKLEEHSTKGQEQHVQIGETLTEIKVALARLGQ